MRGRNMLHGPWKEANAPTVNLHIDDNNVNAEAIEMALAYLYGHHPKLNDNNAFRVLAAASFLDLQVSVFLAAASHCALVWYSFLQWFMIDNHSCHNPFPLSDMHLVYITLFFHAGFMCNMHGFHHI